MPKVLIVGAGIAGLAAAIRMRAKGFDVEVFEANAYPGGKLSEFTRDGFRFDAGPSLFTMPHMVDELFALAGEEARDHFRYQKLDVACHYFYSDGTAFRAPSDPQEFAAVMSRQLSEAPEKVLAFLNKSAAIYSVTSPVFLERSLHRAGTYLNKDALRGFLNFGKLEIFKTMHASLSKQFNDHRTIQFFNRFATYNGSDPYRAPATLNVIPHLEFGFGTFFPEKGMYSITKSLYELALRQGVQFNFNARVGRILLSKGKVRGIALPHSEIAGDIVISNMDIHPTYKRLLPEIRMPRRVLHAESSGSAVIFYWGINRSFEALGLHNIFFSGNYKEEFDTLFRLGKICDDPTVYINITGKLKADDAPPGCENWFVMVNAPANNGQNWDEMIARTRKDILKKLSLALQTDIASLIVTESVLDPRTIEMRTSSYQGALYGPSSNKMMSAFFRHPNFKSSVKGLYFCGGSVHPGGGIPLCLLSAKITADLIPVRSR